MLRFGLVLLGVLVGAAPSLAQSPSFANVALPYVFGPLTPSPFSARISGEETSELAWVNETPTLLDLNTAKESLRVWREQWHEGNFGAALHWAKRSARLAPYDPQAQHAQVITEILLQFRESK